MTRWWLGYGAALLAMGVLDAVWLGWLARDFYQRELGELAAAQVRVLPAALFYVGYPAALVTLALLPLPATWPLAVGRAALLGLVAYATYDLTNLATLRGFSLKMALVDIAWGASASAIAGAAAYWVMRRA